MRSHYLEHTIIYHSLFPASLINKASAGKANVSPHQLPCQCQELQGTHKIGLQPLSRRSDGQSLQAAPITSPPATECFSGKLPRLLSDLCSTTLLCLSGVTSKACILLPSLPLLLPTLCICQGCSQTLQHNSALQGRPGQGTQSGHASLSVATGLDCILR